MNVRGGVAILLVSALSAVASAQTRPSQVPDDDEGASPTALPPAVAEADIEEQLGRAVRRDLQLVDQTGRRVRLGDWFSDSDRRPIVLVLAYYRCPMLCGLVLGGLVDGLGRLSMRIDEQYRVLTVSFDPRDTPAAAAAKRTTTLSALGDVSPNAWPFLVGEEASVRALADDVGFRYAYDARTDQYAHPAAAMVLTPDGRISRYLYGTAMTPSDLRLALLEASDGRIGTIVDRVLMTCYRFDPATRRYGPYLFGFMRIGGAFVLLAVAGLVIASWRHGRSLERGGRR